MASETTRTRRSRYTPEQFGAPPGAQIIPGLVQQQVWVMRGLAYVENLRITEHEISFDVFTQAANESWFFGWRSGSIAVTTSFTWYYSADRTLRESERFFMQESPTVPTRSAPAWLTGNNPTSSEPRAVQGGTAGGSGGAPRTATGPRGKRAPAPGVSGGCAGCGQ